MVCGPQWACCFGEGGDSDNRTVQKVCAFDTLTEKGSISCVSSPFADPLVLSGPEDVDQMEELTNLPAVKISGGVYEGQWKGKMRHGNGKLTSDDGGVFVGQWHSNYAHGQGSYSFQDGTTYEGGWVMGEQTGFAKQTCEDGSKYQGEFKAGRRHGEGSVSKKDGTLIYRGQFCEDRINGRGEYYFGDNRTYRGDFINGSIHGRGHMEWPDGSIYDGHYARDQRHGEGTFIWPDGRQFTGQWANDRAMNGKGLMKSPEGELRPCVWKDGQWHEEG